MSTAPVVIFTDSPCCSFPALPGHLDVNTKYRSRHMPYLLNKDLKNELPDSLPKGPVWWFYQLPPHMVC